MLAWTSPPVPTLPGSGGPVRLRQKGSGEPQLTATDGSASIYVCGITPYDATHLGHANTYVGFDLLIRAWLDAGVEVSYVQNVTDVDDPLLERAAATGVDWRDLAAEQVALFSQDMAALGVIPPDHYVGAVESIPDVVLAVEKMLQAGSAYRVATREAVDGGPGDVYADLAADSGFGAVARLDEPTMLALSAERGGDPGRAGKRHPLDPLLWRRERAGEPAWDGASLGRGRPGWHIECAVIAESRLGVPLSVCGGGSDLEFPHHEMSESHLRLLTGCAEPVRHRVHGGLVGYQGHKMSKSRGNLVLVSRLLADGVPAAAIRLALLEHHYATDWEYTDVLLADAQLRLEAWRVAMTMPDGPHTGPLLAQLRDALADDLDSPRALAAVDAWVEDAILGHTSRAAGQAQEAARAVEALLGVRI